MPKSVRRYRKKKVATAKKALSIAKKALRVNRPETKYFYWDQTGTINVGGGGATVYNLCQMSQGTLGGQLVGNKAHLKNTQLRFSISRVGKSPSVCRLIVVRYREDNGGAPSITNVLNSAGATASYEVQVRNQIKSSDCQILVDRTYVVGAGPFLTTSEDSDFQIVKTWNFKCGKMPLTINNSGTTEQGGLFLFVIQTASITFNARAITYFTDA